MILRLPARRKQSTTHQEKDSHQNIGEIKFNGSLRVQLSHDKNKFHCKLFHSKACGKFEESLFFRFIEL